MLMTEISTPGADVGETELDRAIGRARDALLSLQNEKGYWVGQLQGDSILQSEYILMKFVLGQENDPEVPKIAAMLRSMQQSDGGWNLFPGGPPDLSGTVKSCVALRLMGDDPKSPHMLAAKKACLDLGGAENANSFSKFYFAALGQISYDACPAIPPEIVFLPKWCYFNLYNVSSWTRVMILPLGIVTTLRPVRQIPPERGMRDLYRNPAAADRLAEVPPGFPRTWRDFFLRVDQFLKAYNESPLPGLRQRAMDEAMKWILARMDNSEGLGAIFPSMIYMLIVFRILGYPDDHPRVVKAHKDLRDFFVPIDDMIRVQPCLSPVWDTGIAMHALAETGIEHNAPEIQSGVKWLLSKECRGAADWSENCPHADLEKTSSWFFEFSNPHYTDTDDTAMAAMSLCRLGGEAAAPSVERGKNWLLAMQNDDGGWAAFDRTTPRPILEKIPFADHGVAAERAERGRQLWRDAGQL
ncbi:MAG: prenyltransferase/squalene oxidase repeat-containing protein [Tepidisphaeraceae bacterium]